MVLFFFSSHNWNALFLGGTAVADVMAEKYGKRKSQILDTVSQIIAIFNVEKDI